MQNFTAAQLLDFLTSAEPTEASLREHLEGAFKQPLAPEEREASEGEA